MTDYSFYQDTYHGSAIPQEDWPYCEARAADQLARYKRIYTVTIPEDMPDGEERAVCAMAEALYGFDLLASGEGGPVQSASIGSVSVSYSGAAAQAMDLSPKGQAKELYRCARRYLDIYRGVR
ncbi:MAG: hypothetical protein HDT14_05415 [Oscillibacter sp.]|nr:hypothetical protein [Oscillibacter sp.]